MKKEYSLGEIYRLGLMKNHSGEPYKHKATLSVIVRRLKHRKVKTAYGAGVLVSLKEIERFNSHW